jgi:cysteinyl-tRNA synthetase
MQDLITKLIESKHAYVGEDNCVYFSAQSFATYGAISGNKLDSLKPGHRFEYTEDGAKHFHADWALWKAAAGRTQMIWPSPWGAGFPGWHIECSAMSLKFLDNFVDLHLGGIDLRFPHHENERAQSNSAINSEAVALWVHGEHLLFEGRKMSKSAGNVVLVSDLIAKGLDPLSLRVCLLENRYRSQMDLTWQSLTAANQLLERWRSRVNEWASDSNLQADEVSQNLDEVIKDLSTDLDTPRAMQKLREIEKNLQLSSATKLAIFKEVDQVLGLDLTRKPKPKAEPSKEQLQLIDLRRVARDEGNYQESDRLRDLLKSEGIEVRDNPDGQSWSWLI